MRRQSPANLSRLSSPALGAHYASTNLRSGHAHTASSNSVLYPVATPLASLLQKHQAGAAGGNGGGGGIIRHERTSNAPVHVSFVPEESADLDDDDELSDDVDVNHNDLRHVSTIKIGSSSEGLGKFSPMQQQPPKELATSRVEAAWGSDEDRGGGGGGADHADYARRGGHAVVGGLRSGGFERKPAPEGKGENGFFWLLPRMRLRIQTGFGRALTVAP